MIKQFYIPGYYNYFSLIQVFLLYKQTHPFYFRPDYNIAGSYDLPWGLKWNGGRGCGNTEYSEEEIKKVIEYYRNIPNFTLLHTCTNWYADTDEMLNDELCNNFFEKFYLPQDKIIIANQKLKKYLQKKIPNASFVNSTTLSVVDPDKVNELSKIDEYVVYYSKNLDDEYLKSLLYKDNLEILCGEFCVPNCPARTEHYKAISMSYKGDNSLLDKFELSQKCPRKNELDKLTIAEVAEQRPTFVSNKRITQLSEMGYNKFKIAGRVLYPNDWVRVMVYYFIKPEHQKKVLSVFNEILKDMKIDIITPRSEKTNRLITDIPSIQPPTYGHHPEYEEVGL